jgi:SEC-C motif domain protein
MRSRYSAYVLGLERYLLDTWHPDTRPNNLNLNEDASIKWLGLEVKHFENTSTSTATVEFIARYKEGGKKAERLHEISQFVLTDTWYYLTGNIK